MDESSKAIYASISVGELIDKITILEIKKSKIKNKEKLKNICVELASLIDCKETSLDWCDQLEDLSQRLQKANKKLWEIEDQIRLKENDKEFDNKFIELARAVYITNDERSKIKKEINIYCDSLIIEEKSYREY